MVVAGSERIVFAFEQAAADDDLEQAVPLFLQAPPQVALTERARAVEGVGYVGQPMHHGVRVRGDFGQGALQRGTLAAFEKLVALQREDEIGALCQGGARQARLRCSTVARCAAAGPRLAA